MSRPNGNTVVLIIHRLIDTKIIIVRHSPIEHEFNGSFTEGTTSLGIFIHDHHPILTNLILNEDGMCYWIVITRCVVVIIFKLSRGDLLLWIVPPLHIV